MYSERDKIAELIHRRRRQILVHSVIYYKMDQNIIPDHQWSAWANELQKLQTDYPDIASEVWGAEAFEDFDGSSGFDLPLDDRWAKHKANHLLRITSRLHT